MMWSTYCPLDLLIDIEATIVGVIFWILNAPFVSFDGVRVSVRGRLNLPLFSYHVY